MNDGVASILTIGDELLIGQIMDTNSVWIGQELNKLGWEIHSKETIGDDVHAIAEVLGRMALSAQVVLVTGGLGPTSDDLTLEAMSRYFNVPLVLFASVKEKIQRYFVSKGREMSDLHSKQYYLPEGVDVLENLVGTAPGMYIKRGATHFLFTPGVPVELKYIFKQHIEPKLKKLLSGAIVQSRLFTAGLGETSIIELLGESLTGLPPNLSIAYLPYLGGVRLRLTAKGTDLTNNMNLIGEVERAMIHKLGKYFISSEDDQWNKIIQKWMLRDNLTLATAESCTGGYIANQITNLPGSSGYFIGSVVSYANAVKRDVLKVDAKTLDTYGAVSQQCAEEMVDGLLDMMNADIGIAVTGIAGPGGGTIEKPVGTVFVCVGDKSRKYSHRFDFKSSRVGIVEYSYHQAMYMVYKFLSDQ